MNGNSDNKKSSNYEGYLRLRGVGLSYGDHFRLGIPRNHLKFIMERSRAMKR